MTVKLLLPAYGKHGAAIIGVNGDLRVVERPKTICHSYANGCVCPKCKRRAKEREERLPVDMRPRQCECDRPLPGTDGTCVKCGKPAALRAA
jgi:hypothetical protein